MPIGCASGPSRWRRQGGEAQAGHGCQKPAAKKLSHKLQRELDRLPQQLEAAEAELGRLQAIISAPGFYAGDQTEITTMLERLQQQEQQLEALMERWVELEALQAGG